MLETYSDFRFLVGEETIFFRQVIGQCSQLLYIIFTNQFVTNQNPNTLQLLYLRNKYVLRMHEKTS